MTGFYDEKGRACSKCAVYKPWNEFNKLSHGIRGRRANCRECQKKMNNAYDRDKEKARQYQKQYYETHKARLKHYQKEYKKRRSEDGRID